MAGAGDGKVFVNRKFESETEIEEKRKKRQEEWEKVRKPEDPEECPEEVYDPRSLFDRLQEQKDKKQQEYEEQFKFKNMVKCLDEDESNFLDEVSRQQMLVEKQRRDEDLKELNEYRISFPIRSTKSNASNCCCTLSKLTSNTETRKEPEKKVTIKPAENKNTFSQAKLLAGAVKRRSSDTSDSVKKQKLETNKGSSHQGSEAVGRFLGTGSVVHRPSVAVCVGILPGLGAYSGSSDSDSSTDSEV
ncbi:PSME3-interacting protein-like isoform X3 [Acipenser oxyrinchus oxyrinchus]|uniref:PSME3-interacting protein-like isoform X3 n=1 Tax=Acipenser oxyrinchus oxyrinchus TaxID=40147 RepID=A0AAD8D444_ACIOX|nr:PSME3-interacting protein-like isoform X3 [Acipenser oxyrinchus oxyrinchus]